MKRIAAFLFCLFFILSFSVFALAQKSWVGTYIYGEDAGKNAGGAAIFVEHEITVEKNAGKLSAFISSQGYMTSRALNCTAEIAGDRLKIYFSGYGEDNMFKPYEKGDLLLTLERRRIKGRDTILTYWNKLEPAAISKWKNGRVYFTKEK
jgi:hypothetical protein